MILFEGSYVTDAIPGEKPTITPPSAAVTHSVDIKFDRKIMIQLVPANLYGGCICHVLTYLGQRVVDLYLVIIAPPENASVT